MPNNQSHDPRVSTAPERVAQAVGLSVAYVESNEPEPTDPAGAFFTDDFSSGDLSKSENGFSWTSAVRSVVETGAGRLGGNALRMRFPAAPVGETAFSEQRFELAPDASTAPTDVWVEYYWKIPSNYIHRNNSPQSSNNKFFAIWADNYSTNGDIQYVAEMERIDNTSNDIRALCMATRPDGSGCLGGDSPNPVITPALIGQWVRVRIHVKADPSVGEQKIWINNTLVYTITDYPQWFDGGNNYWRKGYLMGEANSGFDEQTDFYIDEVKVWKQDPQWSFA